jgi:hypothetical protein
MDALTSALASCRGYDLTGSSGRTHVSVSPLALAAGDQSVAWSQEDTWYSKQDPGHATTPLPLSYAVVRVGSTVITAELDSADAKGPLPAPNSALLSEQINKLRDVVH